MSSITKSKEPNSTAGKPTEHSAIGVFDSGFGGLTVLKALIDEMPFEDMVFVGDSARCPYGPRDLSEVENFVLQICSYLEKEDCKLLIVACNTATAAGLSAAQREFNIPIIGVVEPGARAAVGMTKTRRVGVIATEGTVSSGAYEKAIQHNDAGIKVIQKAVPEFVWMVEKGLSLQSDGRFSLTKEDFELVKEKLAPFLSAEIDTLVLGCTHFPLIQNIIGQCLGSGISLVSSAEETAKEAKHILKRRNELNTSNRLGSINIKTTGNNMQEFSDIAKSVLGEDRACVSEIVLPEYSRRVF